MRSAASRRGPGYSALAPSAGRVECRPADTTGINEGGNVKLALLTLAPRFERFGGEERGIANF
jgi:hypothetical protein